jgi:hypothetical protein
MGSASVPPLISWRQSRACATRKKPSENNARVTTVTATRRAGLSANQRSIVVSYSRGARLAAVSAFFFITGLTGVFVGTYRPVIAMGVRSASSRRSHGSATIAAHPWRLRAVLGVLVTVPMGLNAIARTASLPRRASAMPSR